MKPSWMHLPRSLFGRNLLLIVTLIIVAELGYGFMFKQLVQGPRANRMIAVAQLHVDAVRTALALMTPAQRRAYVDQLNAHDLQHVALNRITPADQVPVQFEKPRRRPVILFMQRLQECLQGQPYQIGWQETPEQRLWIGIRIDDANYWYGVDADVFVGRAMSLFIGFAIGSGLLALLGAYLIQRRINRPLHALAAAASGIGRGKIRPLPLDKLPLEIAQVTHSFNQMTRELETAEHERALMLAGVSHDLRTPLAKLRLATEILAENAEPELIDGMVRNIAAADAVIGQFIDFARLGSDETVQPCNINELVTDIALSEAISPITLQLGELPLHACRALALRRAISNLVENALRYGRKADAPGSPVVVRTACSGLAITISVIDTGIGIPPEEMARLRQPFARLDDARNGKIGAGLGLAIVERIARLHGGELLLANRPDGGLKASLLLPILARPAP